MSLKRDTRNVPEEEIRDQNVDYDEIEQLRRQLEDSMRVTRKAEGQADGVRLENQRLCEAVEEQPRLNSNERANNTKLMISPCKTVFQSQLM